MNRILQAAAIALLGLPLAMTPAMAQAPASQEPFSQAELDQMLAPIALYPDALLSQVLMAATYPLEIVAAARWSRANPGLRGDAAVNAVADQDWDPSVISLVAFPDLLQTMDEDLEWTRRLGDAFLYQEQAVLATVQELRRKAEAAGNLVSGEQLRVYRNDDIIYVEPAQTRVVYVPYYNPTVVYGGWWWPAYPPVYWAPPVRYYPAPYYWNPVYYWGPPVTIAPWFYYGAFDWHRRQVVVVNIRHSYWRPQPPHLIVRDGRRWHHEPKHRRGVAYSKADLHQRYARTGASDRTAGRPVRDWRQSPAGDGGRSDSRHRNDRPWDHGRADMGRGQVRVEGRGPGRHTPSDSGPERRLQTRGPGRPDSGAPAAGFTARDPGQPSVPGQSRAGNPDRTARESSRDDSRNAVSRSPRAGQVPVASLGPGRTTDHGYRRHPGPAARAAGGSGPATTRQAEPPTRASRETSARTTAPAPVQDRHRERVQPTTARMPAPQRSAAAPAETRSPRSAGRISVSPPAASHARTQSQTPSQTARPAPRQQGDPSRPPPDQSNRQASASPPPGWAGGNASPREPGAGRMGHGREAGQMAPGGRSGGGRPAPGR